MTKQQPKIREKGQNSLTKFQLSKFYSPESTDIKGFLLSGNDIIKTIVYSHLYSYDSSKGRLSSYI